MIIQVYASLKDFYKKQFEVSEHVGTVTALREKLLTLNPNAADILSVCRFAVNDNFVDNDYTLQTHDTISIIPPGSGG
jgi:molybdopterin synthase sulfur carrier subunit